MSRYIVKWMNQKSQSDLLFGTEGVSIYMMWVLYFIQFQETDDPFFSLSESKILLMTTQTTP